ncbi:hypothetical protein PJ267_12185 [Arthrobacter sp. OVS8]|nr:hypothetical protein PJ267_12185 [Arthrobacter sp. OVS8]
MTGNLYRGQAGLPFSSALRVYEPLEAFPAEQQGALRTAGARSVSRAAVENAELLASLGRITRQGGDPFPTGATDLVRVLAAPRNSAPPAPPAAPAAQVPPAQGIPTPGRRTACCTVPASWCSAPGWPPTPSWRASTAPWRSC